jgi:hypothetical protein
MGRALLVKIQAEVRRDWQGEVHIFTRMTVQRVQYVCLYVRGLLGKSAFCITLIMNSADTAPFIAR